MKLLKKDNPNLPVILACAKSDLKEFSNVRDNYAANEARKLEIDGYIKTSAKTGQNIELLFRTLLEKIIELNSLEN